MSIDGGGASPAEMGINIGLIHDNAKLPPPQPIAEPLEGPVVEAAPEKAAEITKKDTVIPPITEPDDKEIVETKAVEDQEIIRQKEAVEKARKTLFEISQTDPNILKKGKIIYSFPDNVSMFDIANKYNINLDELANSGLIRKIEVQRNQFAYSKEKGFCDAYKYSDIYPVSLEEARKGVDFFDGKSQKLEDMTANAPYALRGNYEKYGNMRGKESHENDAFRVNLLVEDIFNSEMPEFLREHLESQAIELIKRQLDASGKDQESKKPQDYQEALKSLFLENLNQINGGGPPIIRHWIDPTRSTPVENIMAAQVLMYPALFTRQLFYNFGSDSNSSIWCNTLAPYLYKTLSEKGIKGKEALERISKWSLPNGHQTDHKGEKNLPGIETDEKPFKLSDNPNGPTHIYAQQKAEELVRSGLV